MSNDTRKSGKTGYAIGYGKPPVAHRFEPGQSGNPKGRPRKGTSFGEVFSAMLASSTPITIAGKRRRKTVMEITTMRLKKELLSGPMRTVERLLPTIERHAPKPDCPDAQLIVSLDHLTDEQLRALASIKLLGDRGPPPRRDPRK